MSSDPDLTIHVVKTSGQLKKLDLFIDGLASIKREGKIAIIKYKSKALPNCWIFGQDFPKIKGYNKIRAYLYDIKRNISIDDKITIKKMMLEIFINGESTSKFNKIVNANLTLPEGNGFTVLDVNLPDVIQSKKFEAVN